ncbi:hypothetical protein NCC78_27005 [Micromonospora phytophila]|uniref:hypothetical protein n=1 Tax=Micromonospora phytophila TaxID=709888 RepID=UPI00202F1B54|nr:hypothetical protein [Micromonospora phytophila]MCM0678295.1 hypothetical protein [Micromonospora phytophila]
MDDRIGVLGSRPSGESGRLLLTLSDGSAELVEPGLSDDELRDRYGLDRIVHMPDLPFCAGTFLDGPLAGTTGYAVNRLGHRTEFMWPPRPGGRRGTYEVVELADGDRPAALRFIGYIGE